MRISRLLAALALAACHKEEPKEEAQPAHVQIAKVARMDVARVVDVAGPLEPPPGLDVKLAPLSAGRLAKVLVAEGDRVHSGQLLAQLDPTPLRDALAQAEAAVSQAKAQESNAATKLVRAQQAFQAGVAAAQEVDDARLQDAAAKAAVRTAQAALSTARNQFARSELRAPFDGVVAKVSAAAGEPVDASKAVVEVAKIERLELRAPVAPALASVLRAGQAAKIEGGFDGLVIAVSPVVDPATGAALVRIAVPNPRGVLKANSVAHAHVTVDVHAHALAVPAQALVSGPAVEKVADGKAQRTAVETGYEDGAHVEIRSGLAEGDAIVVQGAYALPDGTPVVEEKKE